MGESTAGPDKVGRLFDHGSRAGEHNDGWHLGLGEERCARDQVCREAAANDVYLVIDYKLLEKTFSRLTGRGAVLDQQLDLPAGNRITVLFHIKAGACDYLLTRGCERAGHRHYHSDLDDVLGAGAACGRDRDTEYCNSTGDALAEHSCPPSV